MSDLLVTVRQISNYPAINVSSGLENVLVQQGGPGSPYASIPTANLVATALNDQGAMGIGMPLPEPPPALGQLFVAGSVVFPAPGGGPLYNLYFDSADQLRYLSSGVGAAVAFENGTFVWQVSPVGSAGQLLVDQDLTELLVLNVAGAMDLPNGTLSVARDPATPFEVATLNYVSNNTVHSFNNRIGRVQLNSTDVYSALQLDSPIATQAYVQQAIFSALTQGAIVATWNGRTGNVYLNLSDITCVFFQPGQQPISPTPPKDSNDYSIATTQWVTEFADVTGIATPENFGAAGDGVTDDTTALQAAFNSFGSAGGALYIPGSYYAAGALTVPDGVEIYGNFTPTSMQYTWSMSYFQAPGSKLILGAGITLGRANILRNIMVIANNLPRTNPTTTTAANAIVAQMATNGTGITLSKDNCLLESVQVLGFNYGIYGYGDPNADRHTLRNIHSDNIYGIYLGGNGDTCHIIGAHLWPYLTCAVASNNRNTAIWVKSINANIQIEHCVALGYVTCFLTDSTSATYSQCWADTATAGFATTGACGPVGLSGCVAVACQYGVHHAPSNGAVCTIDASCVLQGGGPTTGNTPATGMTCCVLSDGSGHIVSLGATYEGGQCAFWLGPNTGRNIVIGNTFDDAAAGWDHIWNVDPAVLPLLTKHSNRVTNSTRGLTEQTIGTPAQGGVAVYDQLPQGFDATPIGAHTPSTGAFTNLGASGTTTIAGGTINNTVIGGTTPAHATFAGVSFGQVVASSTTDLSQHLALYNPSYGINVTANTINFVVNSAVAANVTPTGVMSTGFIVGTAAGPTVTSGSAVPSGTQPSGSLYLRTTGAAGARLYVNQGGTTWIAVAGV